jgi:hypothetical protein
MVATRKQLVDGRKKWRRYVKGGRLMGTQAFVMTWKSGRISEKE